MTGVSHGTGKFVDDRLTRQGVSDTLTVGKRTVTVDLGAEMIYTSREPTRADYLAAQAVLDRHVTSSTGRCLECGSYGPCYKREAAVSMISRTMWLPVRRPGASRPGLLGARRVH